jgi:hypothetical protein
MTTRELMAQTHFTKLESRRELGLTDGKFNRLALERQLRGVELAGRV